MIETERLILRRWREEDRVPFAALNASTEVCEFLPKQLTREESDGLADRIDDHFEGRGFGLGFAVRTLSGDEDRFSSGISVKDLKTKLEEKHLVLVEHIRVFLEGNGRLTSFFLGSF